MRGIELGDIEGVELIRFSGHIEWRRWVKFRNPGCPNHHGKIRCNSSLKRSGKTSTCFFVMTFQTKSSSLKLLG